MRRLAPPLAVAAATLAAPARAEPVAMRQAMHDYFAGELAEGWVFAGAGLAGSAAGAACAFAGQDGVYKGAAWPLVTFGVIQLAAGVVLFVRTDRQVAERDAMLASDPGAFYAFERPRMEPVRREFRWLAIAETALVVVGGGLAAYGGAQREHAIFGFGAGLALESALMLALDGRASARADAYVAALSSPAP
jgi:hypothetical protein